MGAEQPLSRRTFVQTTALATAAMIVPRRALGEIPRDEVLRIGVVGCGGRGTGAARDAMRGSEGVELVALGDVFADRVESCRHNLAKAAAEDPRLAGKYKVTDDQCFTGFDAYKKVINSGIDLVILASPPGFRPAHLAAAVEAGKHIMTEKPVAVDPAGIRSVLATYEQALSKRLGIVAGTQRRHEAKYLKTIERIHDGAIGEVLGGQVYWNQDNLWNRGRKPDWSDTEWQIRNWLYFTWLSGDHIVEQHVHNIDVANWVLQAHPIKAVGLGGRQWRTDPAYGHVFDHFAIDFEYPNGVHILSMCRQIDGTAKQIGEWFTGSKGAVETSGGKITGKKKWEYRGPEKPISPYVQEHTDLVSSIRAGKPINELKQVAESTLTAIMGREAAYTGQTLTWEEILNAPLDLTPPTLALGPLVVEAPAMPGRTKLARTWGMA